MTVTIVDPSGSRELQVSEKAFNLIYQAKGFTLKESPAEPGQIHNAEGNQEQKDGAKSDGETGEQTVPTGSVSEGPGAGSDQGSVRPRGRGKGKNSAGG